MSDLTYSQHTHYRATMRDGDTRVAVCCGKWCSWNSLDWDKVTCPACVALRDACEAHLVAVLKEQRERGERAGRADGRTGRGRSVFEFLDHVTPAMRKSWREGYETGLELGRDDVLGEER
jgi:hypothetical protein